MVRRNIKVGRYLGIDVYLHYSWFFIFLLLAWALAGGWFPQIFPGYRAVDYWILGLLSSLLLFISVLMHELAHSVVARRHGLKVDRITLFFFGGMAGMHEKHISPAIEFKMAIAGPMFSLFLSAVFLVVYNLFAYFYVSAIAAYLFRLNLILAIFNLVPGFPLDGGRVLRAIVWYWTKDFKKATRIATTGGKIVAYFLIFAGFANILSGNFGGLWPILIGFFLLTLASLSYEQVVIKDALTGKTAADFAVKRFAVLKPGMSIKEAVTAHFMKRSDDVYPVVEKEKLEGILGVDTIRRLDKRQWTKKKVEDLMTPLRKTPKARLTTKAYNALVKMMKAGMSIIPVVSGKKLLCIIRRDDILRYVHVKAAKEKLKKAGFEIK